jgi:hypothetical protein
MLRAAFPKRQTRPVGISRLRKVDPVGPQETSDFTVSMREHSGARHAFGAKDELKLSPVTSIAVLALGFGNIGETISERR